MPSNALQIVKLRHQISYYNGLMDGIEEFIGVLKQHYLKDKEDVLYALYEASENMYGYYTHVVEEVNEDIYKLEKDNA